MIFAPEAGAVMQLPEFCGFSGTTNLAQHRALEERLIQWRKQACMRQGIVEVRQMSENIAASIL